MSKNGNTAASALDGEFESSADKELGSSRPWMDKCTYRLMEDLASLEEFVDAAIASGRCAVDLETEGLNSRPDKKSGLTKSRIVGICLSYHKDYGAYVPIAHLDDGAVNLPVPAVMEQIRRLHSGCSYLIFHHFKFDGQFLREYGVIMEDFSKIHDTLLLSYVMDSARKSQGLKMLSKEFLDRPMIEIGELFKDKRMGIAFQTLSPRAALRYAASDAMNTLYLFDYLMGKLDEIDPEGKTGLRGVYDIERRCQIVTMEMERNLCLVDVPYFKRLKEEVSQQLIDLKSAVYKEAGSTFNIGSIDQLGDVLFNKLKIPYPVKDRNAKGGYLVGEEVLTKIKDSKIVGMILKLREREKIQGTYIENFLQNVDPEGYCKFQLKQTAADTGRFSSSGGEGLHLDGYSGVNCQNIPAPDPKQKDGINIRKGILARPGYKLVSIDYSGEELRIAANLSREKKWVDEFLYGKGDLHSVTAAVIYNSTPAEMMLEENKGKRGIGKSVNFLTLYGGGPGRLSDVAKIPLEEAKGIIEKFYEGVPQLKDWIEKEGRRARKRGYALTPFGRRRNLSYYFKDPKNKQDIQAGLRRACNGAIQGCLVGTERIFTDAGYLPITTVCERKAAGQDLRVWTGKSWAPFKVHDMGQWETAELNLANGFKLNCDTRHQVLVEGEGGYQFRSFEHLLPGDHVCVSEPAEVEFGHYPDPMVFSGGTASNSVSLSIDNSSDWDFLAYLSGLLLGDGTLRVDDKGHNSLTLCFGKEKVNKLLPGIQDFFVSKGLSSPEARPCTTSVGESYKVEINSKALVAALLFLGNEHAVSTTKVVPQKFYELPTGMRKALLKGYWVTGGCKKRKNRYSFHTPNLRLLQDMQLLMQTLGLGSRICFTNSGTDRLDLMDLAQFERYLGLPVTESLYRTMGKTSVPSWLLKDCYDSFQSVGATEIADRRDGALFNKMKLGKPVLVQTVRMLATKYGAVMPELYLSFPLRSKKASGALDHTYTLSVLEEGHRYDAAGFINKNCGADVIKIALYRVWKYVRNGGFEDEIRILMPIHDEIIYEIREDLLDKHIPCLVEVMKLKDLMQDKLKWPVPFETDAEYGNTLYVDHNYFKEKKKAAEEAVKAAQVHTPVDVPAGTTTTKGDDMSLKSEHKELMALEDLITPEVKPSEDGVLLFSNNPDSPFFDYEVCKTDEIAKRQTDTVWAVLDSMNKKGYARGPRKRVRLIKNNVVVHKTMDDVSVDAFLALAITYLI